MTRYLSWTVLLLTILTGLSFLGPTSFAASGKVLICVIVNKNNSTDEIKQRDIKLIFKGMKKKWGDGKNIIPVNLPFSSEMRTLFDKEILNYSPSEAKEYWVQQKIKATVNPPKVQNSTLGVKRYVASVEQAIGYIPLEEVDDSVKVVYKFYATR